MQQLQVDTFELLHWIQPLLKYPEPHPVLGTLLYRFVVRKEGQNPSTS